MDWEKIIAKACDVFAYKDYGEVVTHMELAAAGSVRPQSKDYRYLMSAVCKHMLETGRMIESVRGVGYRLVKPDDYSTKAVGCAISAGRKLDKGVTILNNAPVGGMSQDGVQRYNNVNDRMRILQAHVAGAKVEINLLDGKRKHPLSVEGHA